MSNDNGFRPTLFTAFSDERLYSFFRAESWNNIDKSTKQQLCQEVVNREAKSLGMVRAPEVSFSRDLDDDTYGESGNNRIQLNEKYFVDNKMTKIVNGKAIEVSLPDGNMQVLNTLFHENQHTYQEQIIAGEIKIDDVVKEIEYKSNDFTVSPVQTENGVQPGLQYLSNSTNTAAGYFAYYLQSTERDANIYAEKKTAEIREMLTEKYGDEPSFRINRLNEQTRGYQATLDKAKREFGNENIEKEINKSLVNHHYNTNYPVDPKVNRLVEAEMIQGYQELYRQKNVELTENENQNSMEGVEAQQGTDVPGQSVQTQNAEQNTTVEHVTEVEVYDEEGLSSFSSTTTAESLPGVSYDSLSTDGQDFDDGISDGNDIGSQDYDGGFDGASDMSSGSDLSSGNDLSTGSEMSSGAESSTADNSNDSHMDSADGGMDSGDDNGMGM